MLDIYYKIVENKFSKGCPANFDEYSIMEFNIKKYKELVEL